MPLANDAMQSPYEPLTNDQAFNLLMVVDAQFYEHFGIDFSRGQGRSTLTSEVADMVYFEGPTLSGKLGSMQNFYSSVRRCCDRFDLGRYLRALVIDWRLTKEEQWRIFTANLYLGEYTDKAVYGFPSAALVYYQSPLAELDEEEWLSLVAMAIDPRKYHPIAKPAELNERVQRLQGFLAGFCEPSSRLDVDLVGCQDLPMVSQQQID